MMAKEKKLLVAYLTIVMAVIAVQRFERRAINNEVVSLIELHLVLSYFLLLHFRLTNILSTYLHKRLNIEFTKLVLQRLIKYLGLDSMFLQIVKWPGRYDVSVFLILSQTTCGASHLKR